MDELGHVRGLGVPVVDQLGLGDELADPAADDVYADHAAGAVLLGHRDDLSRALGLQDHAAAVAAEVVVELDRLQAALGGLRGGEADRRHLRIAVGDPGHAVVVDGGDREPADPLRDQDPLAEPHVRELRRVDEIADRGDRGDARPAERVHRDETPLHGHAGFFVAEAIGDRAAAHRDQHEVGVERLAALERDRDAGVRVLDRLETGAELEADAAAPEGPLQQLRARLVLQRQQLGKQLHDRDLGPEGPPHAGELDADHAAAEDNHRSGDPVQHQRVVRGDHALAVDVETGQAPWLRSAGEHDVLGLVDRVADPDAVRRFQPPRSLDGVDLPARDGGLQALPQPVYHAVLIGKHARDVDPLEGGLDAHGRTVPGVVRDLGGVQQRLGGDAAAVQAGSPDLVLLDQRYALAEFGRAQRAGVPAAATAEHDDVVAADALCHPSSLLHEPVSPTWPTQSSSFHLPSAGLPASLPSATSTAICTSVLTAAPVPPLAM